MRAFLLRSLSMAEAMIEVTAEAATKAMAEATEEALAVVLGADTCTCTAPFGREVLREP
jgi:hypothetical protein